MTFLNHSNNLCLVTLPSPSASADPDKLQSMLEALENVKELCEFLTNPKNASNEPKKLSENLCDGLQTFIGYDKTSKGYNGTGIVYSDLDRLCDAVMGFLYHMLKDVSEKQPYKVGRDILENIVRDLKNNLSTGREGFEVIKRVAQKVREYNERVMKSNKKVKDPITTLKTNVEELKTTVSKINTDNPAQGHDFTREKTTVDEQLQKCKQHAETFCGDMRNAEKHIADLNNDCRVKVNSALKNVTHESAIVHRFSDRASEDYWNMEKEINTILEYLKTVMHEKISTQVNDLVRQLKERVLVIHSKLVNISNTLGEYVDELHKWIEKTKTLIDGGQGHANRIIENQVGDGYVVDIKQHAHEMDKWRDELDKYIEREIKPKLAALVEEAQTQVTELEKVYKEKFVDVRDAVQLAVGKVEGALTGLGWNLINDMTSLKNGIKQDISAYVNKAKQHFTIIKERMGNRDKDSNSVDYNWKLLKKEITELVDDVYENKSRSVSKLNLLGRIVDGIDEYARAFSKANFCGMILPKWVGDIIDKEPVKGILSYYSKEKHGIIKTAISSHINTQIVDTMQKPNTVPGKIKETLNGINDFLTKFAAAVERKSADGLTDFAQQIHAVLEKKDSGTFTNDRKTYLYSPLQSILALLSFNAKQIAEQINRLITQCQIGRVNSAINKAEQIGTTISVFGNIIDSELQVIRGQIDHLGNALDEKLEQKVNNAFIGTNTGEGIGDLKNSMTNYNTAITSETGSVKMAIDAVISTVASDIQGKKGFAATDINIKSIETAGHTMAYNDLTQTINEISTEVCVITVEPTKDRLREWSTEINNKLTKLCAAFVDAGKRVNWYLKILRTAKIGKDMAKIAQNIQTLQRDTLYDAIQAATEFAQEADNFGEQTTHELHSFVHQQIKNVKAILTTAARRNYVSSVKQLLTAFADKVTEELEPLPGEIDRDLQIGFKGMMKTLEDGTTKNIDDKGKNIELLKNQADDSNVRKMSDAFQSFFTSLKKYIIGEINREHKERNEKKHPHGDEKDKYGRRFLKIYDSLNKLLEHFSEKNKYDYKIYDLLDDLIGAVTNLRPENFATPNSPVIDGITNGLDHFVKELRKVYISAYDGERFSVDLIKNFITTVTPEGSVDTYDITEEGRKAANVFLTILEMPYNGLYPLFFNSCKSWKGYRIKGDGTNDDLKDYLIGLGFRIDNLKKEHAAREVAVCCNIGFKAHDEFDKEPDKFKTLDEYTDHYKGKGVISKLFSHLNDYYLVRHLSVTSAKKYPSSVYEMLQWLCGLSYNGVYHDLSFDGFSALFDKPEESEDEEGGVSFGDEVEDTLAAYPQNITASDLRETLTEICHYSYEVLVGIVGHGQANGRYACEFNTNADGLIYPTNMNALICMLKDVLNRLYRQLFFLYQQCKYDAKLGGWHDCYYGKGVGGSSWSCNDLHCANQICDQKPNQSGNQTAECGIKSPLQSFLEDGLQGFLPHPLKSEKGKLECSIKIHSDIPCITPMGFSEIGITASHLKLGKHIYHMLDKFAGTAGSPLTKICGKLNCLLPSAPKTMDDLFSFYYNFLINWNNKDGNRMEHREEAFRSAVSEAYFEKQYDLEECSELYKHKEHYKSIPNNDSKRTLYHDAGDLNGLCNTEDTCYISSDSCGSYIACFGTDICRWFASKHAGLYLTWIVYSTEAFYKLLCSLRDECSKNCSGPQSKCRIVGCAKGVCKVSNDINYEHHEHKNQCNSIVHCRLSHPTLYRYGFTLGNRQNLNGQIGEYNVPKRTCKTFVAQLDKVCGGKSLLAHLVIVKIPEFLWDIRSNFFWLNVALWLLSFLYLLHIMVIRLDLLHIKSHLHSPSSHRIAAQSLLAAGRVNKLNRVFYLQP